MPACTRPYRVPRRIRLVRRPTLLGRIIAALLGWRRA